MVTDAKSKSTGLSLGHESVGDVIPISQQCAFKKIYEHVYNSDRLERLLYRPGPHTLRNEYGTLITQNDV